MLEGHRRVDPAAGAYAGGPRGYRRGPAAASGTSASTSWPNRFRCTRCSTARLPPATRRPDRRLQADRNDRSRLPRRKRQGVALYATGITVRAFEGPSFVGRVLFCRRTVFWRRGRSPIRLSSAMSDIHSSGACTRSATYKEGSRAMSDLEHSPLFSHHAAIR